MPIHYAFDETLRIVRTAWTGDVSLDDYAGYLRALCGDAPALACGRSLADIRGSHFDVHGQQLVEILRRELLPHLNGKTVATAIIALPGWQFGSGRQYQMLLEGAIEVGVFTSEEPALEWLLHVQ